VKSTSGSDTLDSGERSTIHPNGELSSWLDRKYVLGIHDTKGRLTGIIRNTSTTILNSHSTRRTSSMSVVGVIRRNTNG